MPSERRRNLHAQKILFLSGGEGIVARIVIFIYCLSYHSFLGMREREKVRRKAKKESKCELIRGQKGNIFNAYWHYREGRREKRSSEQAEPSAEVATQRCGDAQ